ncbi:Uncharacterized protein GY17_00001733 [Cryptosporidium hominis]|uniref:Ribosome biogenesis protein NOP53 n=3 Tax=Cryptosporidium hominis TaxID=237895 RepID=A0ABX5BFI1_CRYHO|nr:Uncharacterized protein GY17_00001733 [Cryptosporidium hominis]|eukprot:PPS96250.1 Uncharacterized protein GY17_00001733 [Cryptosporidium hominis]
MTMVQPKKKFRKIKLQDENDVWKRGSIEKNIDDSLNSGKLFTFDTKILFNSRSNLDRKKKNCDTIKKRCKLKYFNKDGADASMSKQPLEKVRNLNPNELDIWGSSVSTSKSVNSRMNYPGELLRIKGPSIQIPHSGQSINPSEPDRQDALLRSSSVLNINANGRNNAFPASLVNSFISSYYESDQVIKLTEPQKYHLVNSLLNGKVLGLDSIADLELVSDTKDEIDNNSYSRQQNNGIRKKKSEINREIRRKKELMFNKEKTKIKKLNKDVQNMDMLIQDIDEFSCNLENRRIYLTILKEQIESARRLGVLSKIKIGRNTHKENPIGTLSEVDIQSSNGSLRKLHIEDKSFSRDIVSNIYRRGLIEIPPANDAYYGRRLQKLLRRKRRSKKIVKKVRFF